MAIVVMKDPLGYIRKEEIQKLFTLNSAGSLRNVCMLRVTYYCGRRVSEVIEVRNKDIIFEDNSIVFNILKKGERLRRIKPVDLTTLSLLKEYMERYHIKTHSKLFPICRIQAWNIIKSTAKKAHVRTVNGKYPSFHTLRHSFAVHFMKGGGDLRKLQMMMEHSRIDTTAGYLQYSKSEINDAYYEIFQ